MEQRVSLITLGVADVRRSREFYEALGWRGQEVEETVFFALGGVVLVLWSRQKLAEDAGLDLHDLVAGGGAALAHNVRERHDVDLVLKAASDAGGRLTKPAASTFYGGYAGYFTDPDGHLWEIAHNPGFSIEADGSITLPDFGS